MTSPVRTAADLVALLEQRIGSGILAPGARLEPVRSLAAELQLAPNTVAAAYRILGDRGLVVGEGRRGTFVAARPPLALALAPAEEPVAEGVVDLASGNPDPALLPSLAEALGAVDTTPVLYGHPPVDPQLAAVFRAGFAADGVPADQLAVVGGALDGLERVLGAHLRAGDRVAVEDPGYASVIELLHALGLRPVPVAVDRFGPLPGSLAEALAAGVAAVVVTPRAHNPTGAALDAERAAELRPVLAAAPDVLVVADDHAGPIAGQPYHHLIGDDPTHGHDHDGAARRWATVRSVAKSLGPDLRLAAVAGDELTVRRVAGRQLVGQGWVSHLLQRVVAAMLSDPATPGLLAAASAAYAGRRAVVVDTLGAAGIEVEGRSGMNVWVPVDDEARVVAGMQRRGYAIRSGARFRLASPPGVRISVAATPEPVLAEASAALAAVLDRSRPGGSTRSV